MDHHYAIDRNYTANGLNQYTATGSITPTYDTRGNVASAGSTSYSYDSTNRLTAGGGENYYYDPAGRLFAHANVSAGYTYALNSGDQMIGEYSSTGDLLRRYVHGPGIDEPLVWYEGSGTSDRRYLHADERGSVIAISNGSGSVTNVNAFDEYGIPASGNTGRFQYTGQQWLPELGMQYSRARIYSPTLGRFLQTDPIGYAAGMNLSAYLRNDPVNLVDPLGRDETITVTCNSCVFTPGDLGSSSGFRTVKVVTVGPTVENTEPEIVVTGIRRPRPMEEEEAIVVTALLLDIPEIPGTNTVRTDARRRFSFREIATTLGRGLRDRLQDRLRRFVQLFCTPGGSVDWDRASDRATDPTSVMRDIGMSLSPGNIPGRRMRPNPVAQGLGTRGGADALLQFCRN